MSPRRSCEAALGFRSPVGSSSSDQGESTRLLFIHREVHLSCDLSMCFDVDQVDLASTACTCAVHRDFHPTLHVKPRVVQSNKTTGT